MEAFLTQFHSYSDDCLAMPNTGWIDQELERYPNMLSRCCESIPEQYGDVVFDLMLHSEPVEYMVELSCNKSSNFFCHIS